MKKKILSAFVAAACLTSVSAVSMPAVSALTQGNLEYILVDEDLDGIKDFAKITGCDPTAESISIPAALDDLQVQEIAADAFASNKVLKEFTVSSKNLYFSEDNGVLFNKNATTLVCYPSAKKTSTSYSIPSSVTDVNDYAFDNCTTLSKITIPTSVKVVGGHAFENCTALADITIPSSVESVGIRAFYNTEILANQYRNGLGPIYYADTWIIDSDSSIETVMSDSKAIKAGTTGIAGGAFTGHKYLKLIDVPSTVLYISEFAFYNCDALTDVTLPNSIKTIEESAFEGCDGLTQLTLPNNLKSLKAAAFRDCTKLARINIPSGLTAITESLFEGSAIVSVDIPAEVEKIEKLAFYNCPNLSNVTIRNKKCDIVDKPQTFSNSGTTYDGTITGYEGSTAEIYANSNNRTFVKLTSGSGDDQPSSGMSGDADGNGKLEVRDAATIARLLAQGKKDQLPASADYDGNGDINVRDAAKIAQYLANRK